MFYVSDRAFAQEPFLPTNFHHNANKVVVYTTPLLEPSVANGIPTNATETDTSPKPLYTVQVVCQAWTSLANERVKSVGGRFIKHYCGIHKYTWEGNN